jgi:hypothetical protein
MPMVEIMCDVQDDHISKKSSIEIPTPHHCGTQFISKKLEKEK